MRTVCRKTFGTISENQRITLKVKGLILNSIISKLRDTVVRITLWLTRLQKLDKTA